MCVYALLLYNYVQNNSTKQKYFKYLKYTYIQYIFFYMITKSEFNPRYTVKHSGGNIKI